jgi:hypothetical protein
VESDEDSDTTGIMGESGSVESLPARRSRRESKKVVDPGALEDVDVSSENSDTNVWEEE